MLEPDLLQYEDLTLGKELGSGGFGVVYKASYRHDDVAVKQLLINKLSPQSLQEFQKEAQMMAKLRYRHIVQFYGYCTSPHYCIVMEYMPLGSLYGVLRSKKDLEWPQRFEIGLGVAKGLAFLHQEKILHRDIKSLNVLLGRNYEAKLTDFGLSNVKTETRSYAVATKTVKNDSVGTLQWMAPELFSRKPVFTKKSDVYSLGVTFWELVSCQIPFKDAASVDLIPGWVKEGEREDIPGDCPAELGSLIQQCWQGEGEKRPSADEVVVALKKMLGDLSVSSTSSSAASSPFTSASNSGSSATSGPRHIAESIRAKSQESVSTDSGPRHIAESIVIAPQGPQAQVQATPTGLRPRPVSGRIKMFESEKPEVSSPPTITPKKLAISPQINPPMVAKATNPVVPPVLFSGGAKPLPLPPKALSRPQVDGDLVATFLKQVVEGEQDQAEALLKRTPDLALVSGEVTDLSKRTFKGITGFQYAVWALDGHMWTMIKKYLPDDAAREQLQTMKNGSWVSEHGQSASWQNLIDALQKMMALYYGNSFNEAEKCWQHEVGGAQRLLPVHVVNEYCHPNRPFTPCPDFSLTASRPPPCRTVWAAPSVPITYCPRHLMEAFDWYYVLSGRYRARHSEHVYCALPPLDSELALSDHVAVRTLYSTRTQQRDQLVASLTTKEQPRVGAR